MNEVELHARLKEIKDDVETGWPFTAGVKIDELMQARWGTVDGPDVCGDYVENGSCIHGDCERNAERA